MDKVTICKSETIDLKSTLDGGQAFRWHGTEDSYRGVIENDYPDPGDIYSVTFKRPFWSTDILLDDVIS